MKNVPERTYKQLTFYISAALTVGCVILGYFSPNTIDMVMKDNRSAIYGALVAVYGALLGFMITATSIMLGYTQDARFDIIKRSQFYDDLFDILVGAANILGVATLVSIIALLIDREKAPNKIAMYICLYISLVVFWRVLRAVTAFQETVLYVARESRTPNHII